MSTDPEPELPGWKERPVPPLLRVLGAVARAREAGETFTCCSRETMAADGVRDTLERLGYVLVAYSPELFLIEFDRPAVRAAAAA